MGFPLPLFGNGKKLFDYKNKMDAYSPDIFTMYLHDRHGEQLPSVIYDLKHIDGSMWINDPEIANELYVTKNKYFNKHKRTKANLFYLFGNSLVFDESNELWAKKRKHITAALYKEKLVKML